MKYLIHEYYQLVLIGWFISYILHQEFNLPYLIRMLFKMSMTKYVKLIDCYPCVSFWVTLGLTWSPLASIGVYLIAVLIDRLRK